MYDTLLQLPLFQGMCKDDFTSIIEKVKFHFQNYSKGKKIISQGENCMQIVFLLSGEIASESTHSNYTLSEYFQGPAIIEPQSLLGISPCYTATYIANDDARILTIDKSSVTNELMNYEIFRLNYMNLLCSQVQTLRQKAWNQQIGNLNEKLIHFFLMRCQKKQGTKMLNITMNDLAILLNENRINVSRCLNKWQEQGLIQLRRKEIFIPQLENLT